MIVQRAIIYLILLSFVQNLYVSILSLLSSYKAMKHYIYYIYILFQTYIGFFKKSGNSNDISQKIQKKLINPLTKETLCCTINAVLSFFCIDESLAQLVEHLTFNQVVRGSIPRWLTIIFYFFLICKMAPWSRG